MNVTEIVASALTITEFELRKVFHDSSQIFIRAVQPLLWLVVFGEVFAKVRVLPTTDFSYLQFLTPGVLAQSVIFVAIFFGMNLVWERDLGLLQKLLSTPVPRPSIIIGKAFAAGVRSIFQAVLIFVLALVIQVHLNVNPISVLGVLVIVVLTGMCFSSLSIFLASLVKTRERMMGMAQVITMPLFFASSAIYPVDLMPDWLKIVSRINPLTYVVDALRALLVTGDFSRLPLDVSVVAFSVVLLVSLATITFRRIIE